MAPVGAQKRSDRQPEHGDKIDSRWARALVAPGPRHGPGCHRCSGPCLCGSASDSGRTWGRPGACFESELDLSLIAAVPAGSQSLVTEP